MLRRGTSWRRMRSQEPAELNITAFMNLMVVLVPFLLITAVFSRLAILELNLPSGSADTPPEEQTVQLEVIVRDSSIEIGARGQGVAKSLPSGDTGYDLDGLNAFLAEVKGKYPEKTDATLLLEQEIAYEVVVQVMDAMRVYDMADENSETSEFAELFPDISIGDAPIRGSTES